MVDALRVLLDGYLVERFHRDVAHSAIRLGHDVGLIPVVGRRGHDFVEVFGRATATYLVDTRHRQVFPDEHQVARHTGWIHYFFLILMTCSKDAMRCRPVADGLHEALAIECGVQAKEEVPGICCLVSYVVPEGRIECFGRETITHLKLFVEVACPHPSLSPIHRGFVEEGGDDGLSEVVCEMLVVSLMRILNKQADCLGGEVVHVRVAVLDALANHHTPARLLGSCPRHLTGLLVIIVAQRNNLLGVGVPSHNRHQFPLKGYLAVEGSAAAHAILCLVESLNGVVGMIVHEGSHARTVDGPHASAWEAVFVVDGHMSAQGTGLLDGISIELEVTVGEIVRTESTAKRQDSTAAIAIGLDHPTDLFQKSLLRYLRIVPEPQGYGTPQHRGLGELLRLEQRCLLAPGLATHTPQAAQKCYGSHKASIFGFHLFVFRTRSS